MRYLDTTNSTQIKFGLTSEMSSSVPPRHTVLMLCAVSVLVGGDIIYLNAIQLQQNYATVVAMTVWKMPHQTQNQRQSNRIAFGTTCT